MAKIIYLKPEQEITSLIGYLWQAEESEIVLVVPKNSALVQNHIALKILRREAESSEKEIIFVIRDKEERLLLERLGFQTRAFWPKDESAEAPEDHPGNSRPPSDDGSRSKDGQSKAGRPNDVQR